jgi:hypothetical protein
MTVDRRSKMRFRVDIGTRRWFGRALPVAFLTALMLVTAAAAGDLDRAFGNGRTSVGKIGGKLRPLEGSRQASEQRSAVAYRSLGELSE